MHHPIAEMGGENLPFDRFFDYKTDGRRNLIASVQDFFIQPMDVVFQVQLKLEGVYSVAFVSAGVIISRPQIIQKMFILKKVQLRRFRHF